MQEEQFKIIGRSVFPAIKFYRNGNAVIAQLPHGDSSLSLAERDAIETLAEELENDSH